MNYIVIIIVIVMIKNFQVIDGTEHYVIIIYGNVTVIELLRFYYNLD